LAKQEIMGRQETPLESESEYCYFCGCELSIMMKDFYFITQATKKGFCADCRIEKLKLENQPNIDV
jgi:hypothetical protein